MDGYHFAHCPQARDIDPIKRFEEEHDLSMQTSGYKGNERNDHAQQLEDNGTACNESFRLHAEACSEPFKEDCLKKVLELKGSDYKLLCSYVRYTRLNSLTLKFRWRN